MAANNEIKSRSGLAVGVGGVVVALLTVVVSGVSGQELQAIAKLVEIVGVSAVLLYIIILQFRRQDAMGDRFGERMDSIHDKRVEEAKEASKITLRTLEIGERFLDKVLEGQNDIIKAINDIRPSLESINDKLDAASTPGKEGEDAAGT